MNCKKHQNFTSFDKSYSDLAEAFKTEWTEIYSFLESEIEFYLVGQSHYILHHQMHKNSIISYFWNTPTKFLMKPLFCKELSSPMEGCFDENQQANLKFKT